MLAKLVVKQVVVVVVHSIMEVFMPMEVISVKQVGRGVNVAIGKSARQHIRSSYGCSVRLFNPKDL
jgi:hypothetical protein